MSRSRLTNTPGGEVLGRTVFRSGEIGLFGAQNRFRTIPVAYTSLFVLVLLFLLARCAGADLRGVEPRTISAAVGNEFETARSTDVLTVQDELRALAGRAVLPELRWPDYSDYRIQVQKFYEPTGYSPAWIQNSDPDASSASDDYNPQTSRH